MSLLLKCDLSAGLSSAHLANPAGILTLIFNCGSLPAMMSQYATTAGHRPSAPPPFSLSVAGAALSHGHSPLSFSLQEGECLALFGLSDIGNTRRLLVDTLAGYRPLTSGQIIVGGQNVTDRPAGSRGIAIVSRQEILFDHLTVRQNIAFPLRARSIPASDLRRLTNERLALLGLDSVADVRPPALSEGCKFRTALARALATDPAVVVLDDVFSGLDTETRRDIHLRLNRLRRARSLSTLLLTQDRSDAFAAASTIGVMADGDLLQTGTPAMLIERPSSARIASAMGDANVLVGLALSVSDDIADVRLACGAEMSAVADPSLSEGDLVELCIRPGQIAPLFQRGSSGFQEETEGCLPATLAEITRPGDITALRFRLADGTELVVHRPAGTLAPGISPGCSALLAWRGENALAFPSDGKRG
mgnify:CR=1 FL=1